MSFEFKLPDVGEGVVEGEIVRWLVKEGDTVAEDQPLVEVMTDKATVEIPSPRGGLILRLIGKEGETVPVGATLVVIETDGTAEKKAAAPKPTSKKASPPPRSAGGKKRGAGNALATPAVRRLAREMGIDLSQVEGSGPRGRITREDLDRFQKTPAGASPEVHVSARQVESIPYRGLRKRIGENLHLSKSKAPHFTYVEEVDATELVRMRQRLLASRQEGELVPSYLPYIMKAIVRGLEAYPLLNSTLDEEEGVIRLKKYYNLGIATATADGLIVPVVKNVDQKSVLELARELARLAETARAGKIQLEDLKDGTFTITSLGTLGGVLATPIINYPEVAILGVHQIKDRPVVRGGEITIRKMMNLSLSLDHRVVDGHVGAQFLHHILPLIESPGLLLLDPE